MDEKLIFNGINGATGAYYTPEMTAEDLANLAMGEEIDEEHLQELRNRDRRKNEDDHLGVKEGVDPKDLSQAGWGVIFAEEEGPAIDAIKEALSPLLALRRQQAGDHYSEYSGKDGFRANDSKSRFLARHKMGPGPADPDKVPYYLLIVGDPGRIPYRFQYELDVQYAVGRIHFKELEDYANYARSVVEVETGQITLPRRATFFGVENEDDPATGVSAGRLVRPLAKKVGQDQPDWQVETFLASEAKKATLERVYGEGETPALLFTASHGMGFPNGDPQQLSHQGALLCQDWPGPKQWGSEGGSPRPIPRDFFFSGEDLGKDASVHGIVNFYFACFGAGTPLEDDYGRSMNEKQISFWRQAFGEATWPRIAPVPFLANLPTKMLSHPKGGALAVVGHVERAWPASFVWEAFDSRTVFESTLKRLMEGHPVGSAMEFFDQRYAELSTMLTNELDQVDLGVQRNDSQIAGMWIANNDARSYVVIGDPAVRVAIADLPRLEESAIEIQREASTRSSGATQAQPPTASGSPGVASRLARVETLLASLEESVGEIRREVAALKQDLPPGVDE